jgi:hypothetical protein
MMEPKKIKVTLKNSEIFLEGHLETRGVDCDLIICDEMAAMPQEVFYQVIEPLLSPPLLV